MRPEALRAISATIVFSLTTMVVEFLAVPQWARIIPGVLMVFFLPGYAIVRTLLSTRSISRGERLLASIAVSIVITICTSVLLGLTVGLSQRSIALGLSGVTFWACLVGLLRERHDWRSYEDSDE
jgi:uncharacterized membrane protein